LVTHDGTRVETKGPWQVKGRQVVFTLPGGTLSAMRLSEVDLDASAAATAAAREPAEPAVEEEKAPRKPVLVLTNKDVRPAAPPPAEEEDGDGEDEEEEAEERPGAAKVELVSWKSVDSSQVDGLEIVGTIKNNDSQIAANLTVAVTVNDDQGEPLYETTAFVRTSGLAPGRSTTFRALLPGIYQLLSDPIFDVRAGSVTILGRNAGEGGGEGGSGGAGGGSPATASSVAAGGGGGSAGRAGSGATAAGTTESVGGYESVSTEGESESSGGSVP
jgi:hypothetical protein